MRHAADSASYPRFKAQSIPAMRAHQDDIGGLNEQHSQIAIAALADPTKDCSPSSTELARHETDLIGKVPAAVKHVALANCRDYGSRDQAADPRDGHNVGAVLLRPADLFYFR